MYNVMNQVNWYKFEINGKRAIVMATSLIGAIAIIESEIRRDVKYSYIGMVE